MDFSDSVLLALLRARCEHKGVLLFKPHKQNSTSCNILKVHCVFHKKLEDKPRVKVTRRVVSAMKSKIDRINDERNGFIKELKAHI